MSYDEFAALEGDRVRVLDNGEYTLGVVTREPDGTRALHHLNCNMRERVKYDYRVASSEIDAGRD